MSAADMVRISSDENGDPDVIPHLGGPMTDAELIEVAAGFREGMLGDADSTGTCAMVCWPLAGFLEAMHGIECECIESDLERTNHVWIKLADGRALDPTADQFEQANGSRYPAVYLGAPADIHVEARA